MMPASEIVGWFFAQKKSWCPSVPIQWDGCKEPMENGDVLIFGGKLTISFMEGRPS